MSEYGDAVRIRMGPKTLYLFNHPDHAKHVLADNNANYRKGIGYIQARRALGNGLLTSDGELWKEQRRTVQPLFGHARTAEYADVVSDEADKLATRLKSAQNHGSVDVVREMTAFTLRVLGRTLLDLDSGLPGSIGRSFETVQDQAMFEMQTMGMVPQWLPLPTGSRFLNARRELGETVDDLVAYRSTNPDPHGDDLLLRLLRSAGPDRDSPAKKQRIRDDLITLLLAGHETTASMLGWTFHLLDGHPEVMSRIRSEAETVLGDRRPKHEDLHSLPYTMMVLQESIRLFPPVWILPRRSRYADEIGGYHVPAGADVLICPYTLHRNPKFWDRPDRFDPERFRSDRAAERPRYAHIPFGAGPRFCVGNQLGMMEAVFVLVTVAKNMRLSKSGRPPVPEPMLSLRLGGGLPMKVHGTDGPFRPSRI
nr:cytochrome P450 [Actinopolyspora mzabensis]